LGRLDYFRALAIKLLARSLRSPEPEFGQLV